MSGIGMRRGSASDKIRDLAVSGSRKSLSGRLLARNAMFNFAGMATPMLVGLFAIPYLIDGMGKERFGLLAIIWMGVGYFSLFDMGLGRALTKLVAERLGRKDDADLPELIWTALWIVLGLGLAGMVVVWFVAEPLIGHLLKVPESLKGEGVESFRLLAASIPIVIGTTALVGILEAHQRFAKIAAVRIPLGVMTFLGPVISLQFSPSLVWATAVLIAARTVAFGFYFAQAAKANPALKRPMGIAKGHLLPLFSFGGWLTVSNIIGPLMVYFDRFLIGAIISMTAVAFYVTPYEVLSRLQTLPGSIMGVLFPAMTAIIAGERNRLAGLYGQVAEILLLLMLPIMSGVFLFAPEALELWLGAEFRVAATPVVHWLSAGWMINYLARPPFTVLQSAGRPDLIAKTHFLELLPYGVALWVFTQQFGIAGTAAAWFLRGLADTVILNELARRKLPELGAVAGRIQLTILSLLVGFFAASLIESLILRGLVSLAVTIACGFAFWPRLKAWYQSEGESKSTPVVKRRA